MKATLRGGWYASACGLVVGAIFLSNWPGYHFQVIGATSVLYYFFVPIVLLVPLVASRPKAMLISAGDPLILWFLAYVATGTIWMLLAGQFLEIETQQWRIRVLALVILYSAIVFALAGRAGFLGGVLLFFALVTGVNNWVDFLIPFQFVPADSPYSGAGRGAGLYVNANQAGTAILIMVLGGLPFIDRKYRAVVLMTMLIGILPTFSRSSLVCVAAAMVLVVAMGQTRGKQLALMLLLAPIPVIASVFLLDVARGFVGINLGEIEDRVAFWLFGVQDSDVSFDERRYVMELAWEMFKESPIYGNGIGSTFVRSMGPGSHNMYLMLAAEHGLIGVAFYVSFLALVWTRGWEAWKNGGTAQQRDIGAAICGLAGYFAVGGQFSHNLLEEPSTMFALGLLIGMASKIRLEAARELWLRQQTPSRGEALPGAGAGGS